MEFKRFIGITLIYTSFFCLISCSPGQKKEEVSASDDEWGSCPPPPPPGFTSCEQWTRFKEKEEKRQKMLEEGRRKIRAKVKKEWGL